MPRISEQVEWLNLVDRSGPFLEAGLLDTVFPQGLDKIETPRRQRLRSAYEEWRDAVDEQDALLGELHSAWVRMVLQDMLEYEDEVLVSRELLDGKCSYHAPEQSATAAPDYAVRGDDGKHRMLVAVWPPETDLEKPVPSDSWTASPLDRMTLLCRANDVRVGIVTDGERWMVVNAPVGATSGYVAWLARLWWQEPVTLKAFQSLLGVRRCFGPKEETLRMLLERSAGFQGEITDTLGEQVRRAVEILVQSLGRADQDRNGELLKDVPPVELYEAGLTVMMRMVFTLCAEERGLLLLGDPSYDQHYAISTLRALLREDADRFGVEVLERRHDAWSRILAVFRAIYGGVEHESLRMPALGGSLFDPDRFPMLEGRAKGTTWRDTLSVPLPIDNRTVLLLLDALQVLTQKGGAQLLSYRALDVEQIGHVYEGLLEYTVAKLDNITVGLLGSQKVRYPSITLTELDSLKAQGQEKAIEHLSVLTGRWAATIGKALTRGGDDEALIRLIHACGGDEKLARRLLPFADLIRADSWCTMLVYKAGSFAVVHGSDRRETGTHYTPKSLTESIVEKTLEPVVYSGPAEGEVRERWKLKTAAEILDLKVCDPAMGSGAFLVQACRYLADRLVDAWAREEVAGKSITADGNVLDALGKADPLPKLLTERLIVARRLITERCLYGVDINPLAVELAKLSIWLVTIAKGRPFGFLGHNLRCGDSLFGIHILDQLTKLAINPDETGHQERLFGQNIGKCIDTAVAIRLKLRAIPIRDIRDVQRMALLDSEAGKESKEVNIVADAMVGIVLAKSGQPGTISTALDSLAVEMEEFFGGNVDLEKDITKRTHANLSLGLPEGKPCRKPFHWPVEFPELISHGGFDAIVGNPPFLGGKRISTIFGKHYHDWLKLAIGTTKGAADLCAYFCLRAYSLLRHNGCFGLLATNTISQGDTREVGLAQIVKKATIFRAIQSMPWPGVAGVDVALVHVFKGKWTGGFDLGNRSVSAIDSHLTVGESTTRPERLIPRFYGTKGTYVHGEGFILEQADCDRMIVADKRNRDCLRPYLIAQDFTTNYQQQPSRWAICFGDMTEKEARGYPLLYEHLVNYVKPHRDLITKQVHEKSFWKHWDRRDELYTKLRGLKKAIICPEVSKYCCFEFVSTDVLFSHMVNVIASDSVSLLAVLQSELHVQWAWQHGSTMRNAGIRYTTSDCFNTFPFPIELSLVEQIGDKYFSHRRAIMDARKEGLTKTYNRFHDRLEHSKDIVQLRLLQEEMDVAVAVAFGWNDLTLDRFYCETKQGVRYTISETSRRMILDRIFELNHLQHVKEVANGLHNKLRIKANASMQ